MEIALKLIKKALDKTKFFCYNNKAIDGRLAQLGEHLPYKQRVIGSSPILSTKKSRDDSYSLVQSLARTETVVNDS